MAEPEEGNLLTADPPQTTQPWHSSAYDELVEKKGWKGGDDALQSYNELETALGSRVKLPTPESSAEEISTFYKRLGCPENPDAYELEKPELPEGMTYDEAFEKAIRSIAYDEGLTKNQMHALHKAFNEYQVNKHNNFTAEMQRTREEGERLLKEGWGADYGKNLETAKRACQELGGDDFVTLLVESGLGNNPVMVKTFFGIGKKILSDTLIKGQGVKGEEGYKPQYPNSPEQYATGDDEESKKARAYFEARGHTY